MSTQKSPIVEHKNNLTFTIPRNCLHTLLSKYSYWWNLKTLRNTEPSFTPIFTSKEGDWELYVGFHTEDEINFNFVNETLQYDIGEVTKRMGGRTELSKSEEFTMKALTADEFPELLPLGSIHYFFTRNVRHEVLLELVSKEGTMLRELQLSDGPGVHIHVGRTCDTWDVKITDPRKKNFNVRPLKLDYLIKQAENRVNSRMMLQGDKRANRNGFPRENDGIDGKSQPDGLGDTEVDQLSNLSLDSESGKLDKGTQYDDKSEEESHSDGSDKE